MVEETILQSPVLIRFILPFLLVFFIVFAILEKTKIFGEGKKQLNSLISFVIGLIFVSVLYPTEIVSNLVLFLTVALVAIFVLLLIWGFIFGDVKEGFKPEKWMKIVLALVVGVAFIVALLWATGFNDKLWEFVFQQTWSTAFWTNLSFIIVIAIALALILSKKSS
jgi:multisubunit Na+/H+ antiporter MnhB subunit